MHLICLRSVLCFRRLCQSVARPHVDCQSRNHECNEELLAHMSITSCSSTRWEGTRSRSRCTFGLEIMVRFPAASCSPEENVSRSPHVSDCEQDVYQKREDLKCQPANNHIVRFCWILSIRFADTEECGTCCLYYSCNNVACDEYVQNDAGTERREPTPSLFGTSVASPFDQSG